MLSRFRPSGATVPERARLGRIPLSLAVMPTIDYGDDLRVEVPAGSTVLRASLGAGFSHGRACGGRGRCTTCRIRVEEGLENCPPPSQREAEALAANGLEAPIRLACQLRPTGDLRVRILIPEQVRPADDLPPAVEEQVAALFIDLRGFTRFAETRLPFDVCSVLNRYFDIMGGLVEGHRGRILDYLGDGLMVLFRPGQERSPALRAVACALDMRRAGLHFASYAADHFQAELSVGQAVHVGRAVVGDMGYFRERHLNAVGDVLNVVARLEDHNRDSGTDVLVSAAAAKACDDAFRFGASFELALRGRDAPISARELLG
jgi:adenylate cyclase